MVAGAAGDSRKACAAKTVKTVELFYLAPVLCSVKWYWWWTVARVSLKRNVFCVGVCDPQLQNLNSCQCRNLYYQQSYVGLKRVMVLN